MMQLRLIGSITSLILCSLSLSAQTSDPNSQKPPEPRKSAHQLYVEDQEDTRTIKDAVTQNIYLQHVKVRQASLRASLAAGEVKTGDDFVEAAYIFQHGDTPDDFLFAHILAMEGMARGIVSAKWIAAATLDRYLQAIKQPQVFGTNYILDPTHPVNAPSAPFPSGRTLEPYNDNFLSDSLRTDFCVPSLTQQQQNIAMFNAGNWPRETMHPPCH
jgi:hypothetical protein